MLGEGEGAQQRPCSGWGGAQARPGGHADSWVSVRSSGALSDKGTEYKKVKERVAKENGEDED